MVLCCHDNPAHAPVTMRWTQAGRTTKVGASKVVIGIDSRESFPAHANFRAMRRGASSCYVSLGSV